MAKRQCRCFTDVLGVQVQCGKCKQIAGLIERNKTTVSPWKVADRQIAGMRRLQAKYRDAARSHGREWTLTEEQAFGLFQSPCFYCGDPPATRDGKIHGVGQMRYRDAFRANGIDRIDSSAGYTPLNTVACCAYCNRAKSDRPLSEFMEWAVRFAKATLESGDDRG